MLNAKQVIPSVVAEWFSGIWKLEGWLSDENIDALMYLVMVKTKNRNGVGNVMCTIVASNSWLANVLPSICADGKFLCDRIDEDKLKNAWDIK
ncbi:hypothetical protein ACS0TY_018476 [Phlomoides rotata]